MSGIYIHIPFCRKKCNYCNFHFSTNLNYKPQLIEAIIKELIIRKNELQKPIKTIYFGGGTPSILLSEELLSVFRTLQNHYNLSEVKEITLEANPDDLSLEYLTFLKEQTPVNRLSIGIQSFFEEDLVFMNRAHNSEQAENCIKNARKLGFDNFSIDLIYGGQTTSDDRWISNLKKAIELQIPHLSSYALTVEPKTVFESQIRKKLISDIDEDKQLRHFEMLCKILKENNYYQYEFSNFGKENFFAVHNTSYWKGEPYIGIGPSAHSFNGKNIRSWNIANNIKYIKTINQNLLPSEKEEILEKDIFNEKIMLGLRTMWGLNISALENEFSEKLILHLHKELKIMEKEKLIFVNNNILTVNPEYLFQTDGIISKFFFID